MKFEKLYNLVMEAGFRPSAPKNMGGSRIQRVKDAEGPASYSSSSVGKNDNPENVVPISRWEFDPSNVYAISKDGKLDIEKRGDIGASAASKVYNTMFSSFGLLLNDNTFNEKFNTIADTFGKRRLGYNLTKNVTLSGENVLDEEGEIKKEKYDYEAKLDNLEFMKAKKAGEATEIREKIRIYNAARRDFELSPREKDKLEEEYEVANSRVLTVERQNKLSSKKNVFFELLKTLNDVKAAEKDLKSYNNQITFTKSKDKQKSLSKLISTTNDKIAKYNSKLNDPRNERALKRVKEFYSMMATRDRLEGKYLNSKMSQSSMDTIMASNVLAHEKLAETEKRFQEIVEELESNYQYIDQINENNQVVDSAAQVKLVQLVRSTAERLLLELDATINTAMQSPQTDWNIIPQNNAIKITMLQALASEDSSINPFIGYLERFQRAYDNREYSSALQLNKNVNITSMRDFETLPFSIILKIYKGVADKPIQLKTKEYDESKDDSWDVLSDYLKAFRGMKGDELFDSAVAPKFKTFESQEMIPILSGLKVRDVWANDKSKDFIKRWINETGLPESFKTGHIIAATPKLMFTSRTGANSFFQLWSALDSDIRGTKVKKESFDKLFDKLISEKVWDDDDFKLDTMEILSYYK